jgi:hypothetical protein
MKRITLSILVLILAACQSDLSPSPSPTGRGESPTSTPGTPTPIPTATIPPQFIAMQEQIAQSNMYILNAGGQIEMQTSEGTAVIPGILVSPDGKMTFNHDGQELEVNAETLKFDDEKFTFKTVDGKTFVYDGTTLSEEIREFVPANTIVLEKEGGVPQSLRLNENANLKDVYEDMTIWFMGNYTGLPENQELKEKINKLIEENPEQYGKFKGIGNSADHALRVEFMQFVLKESGGLLTIKNHKNDKMEVDFNLPPAIVVQKVNEVDPRYDIASYVNIARGDKRIGMGVLINANIDKRIQIRIQYRNEALLKENEGEPFIGYGLAGTICQSIRLHVARRYFGNDDSTSFNTNLYMFSTLDPAHPAYFGNAIKYKNRFLLVDN